MRTYARIHLDVVAELFTTARNMSDLFHQHLYWVDVTTSPEVQLGWAFDGSQFKPPAHTAIAAPGSLVQLQAQLASLAQQVAALAEAKP